MLRNIADFARGFVFGLVVGGSAGMLVAPAPGRKSQSALQSRIEATQVAFREGRAQAEKELLDYFERARQSSTGRGGFQ